MESGLQSDMVVTALDRAHTGQDILASHLLTPRKETERTLSVWGGKNILVQYIRPNC
jgi:hypothetical protein